MTSQSLTTLWTYIINTIVIIINNTATVIWILLLFREVLPAGSSIYFLKYTIFPEVISDSVVLYKYNADWNVFPFIVDNGLEKESPEV